MAYEQRPGQFNLFKNDKEGNDKRPDYTGDGLDPDGKPIRVSAWIKAGKNGKFMSCNIQYKNTRVNEGEAKPTSPSAEYDDDIPF